MINKWFYKQKRNYTNDFNLLTMKKVYFLSILILGLSIGIYSLFSVNPPSKDYIAKEPNSLQFTKTALKSFPPFSQDRTKPLVAQTTFEVCDVIIPDSLLPQKSYRQVIEARMVNDTRIAKEETEATAEGGNEASKWNRETRTKINENRALWAFPPRQDSLIIVRGNPFASAVELAYAEHRPLIISPDMIWLLICQGFAIHVDQNGEKLREHFVQYEGKKNLEIERTDLLIDDIPYWEDAIAEFSWKIGNHVGEELKNLTVNRFSTTTAIEATAFEVTLMDAMSSYFTYSMEISCGIPSITLEGSVEDWEKIERDFEKFAQYDLEWWVNDLKPVLHQFTQAAKGKVDKEFWQNIYDVDYASGGCAPDRFITGWVLKFYPYLEDKSRNQIIGRDSENDWVRDYEMERMMEEISKMREQNTEEPMEKKSKKEPEIRMRYVGPDLEVSDLPLGISKADVIVHGDAGEYKIDFLAGFVGISQDAATKALRPEINWAVVDSGRKPTKEEMKQVKENTIP